jgi:hypothetical protein
MKELQTDLTREITLVFNMVHQAIDAIPEDEWNAGRNTVNVLSRRICRILSALDQ